MHRLPDGVKDLLATRIDSFEKLELIVRLHTSPTGRISVAELAKVLGMPTDAIQEAARELTAVGLVESTGDHIQLLPLSGADSVVLAELVQLYREDWIVLVKALSEIATDRIRNMAARRFSEAFVFRKKPERSDDG
jgi:hypothetical protein